MQVASGHQEFGAEAEKEEEGSFSSPSSSLQPTVVAVLLSDRPSSIIRVAPSSLIVVLLFDVVIVQAVAALDDNTAGKAVPARKASSVATAMCMTENLTAKHPSLEEAEAVLFVLFWGLFVGNVGEGLVMIMMMVVMLIDRNCL
mmetsp:Transcript_28438/g.41925  ORF Transcript_28438/g.41925 Transcript_28438/m.41925 type:complete len:144 (+) Transcript_28438:270-701(+)